MNSPQKINYETRPFKFTERKMLLSSFARLCGIFNSPYQYIGFGGLSFTDFKLFHKELHIDIMISIEGGNFTPERLYYNCPYSFIQIYNEISTLALTRIDITKKSIVWLDYDGVLDNYMFEDLFLLMNKLPVGSIYLMTCNRQLKSEETGEIYKIDEFKEKFGSNVPFDIKLKDFSGEDNFKTIRKLFLSYTDKIINGRNRNDESLHFQQLFNIIYQENRGAQMFTFGGIILDREMSIIEMGVDKFDFISMDDKPYVIKIPNLTSKEFQLIDKHLNKEIEVLEKKNIISSSEINQYKQVYKYIPHFFDIRV